MKKGRNLWVLAAVIVVFAAIFWFSSSIQGVEKTYELRPQIAIPQYRTDAARAIDAYERLMERYMDLTERNLFVVADDVKEIVRTLDSMDKQLKQLTAKITAIEKALGIEQPKPDVKKPQPKAGR